MARTLLVLGDGALFADTQLDLSALDRWERAVVEEAGGWDTAAPMHRRALSSWREMLMSLLALVRPDAIAVTTHPALAPRRAAVSVLVALPHRPAVTGPLRSPTAVLARSRMQSVRWPVDPIGASSS